MKASVSIVAFAMAILVVSGVWAAGPASAPAVRAPADLPVGTLMPVAEIVEEVFSLPGLYPPSLSEMGLNDEGEVRFHSRGWALPPVDSGLLSSRAVVCKLTTGKGKQWSAALDSRSPDDQTVNVVRLDVTGQGQFQNAPILPLNADSSAGTIDPVAVNLELDGRTIPVIVSGFYTRDIPASQPSTEGAEQAAGRAPNRYLTLTVGTAMSGMCRFGQKAYTVKLADTNGNLALGDPVQVVYSQGRLLVRQAGDSMTVFSKQGSPPVSRTWLGHPVLVDGVWYDLKVGPGGGTVEATARAEPVGTVVIGADKWSALLIREDTVYSISGGREGVSMPAGEYDIVSFEERSRDYILAIPPNSESAPGTRRIKVEAGQTLMLHIGGPLKCTPKCTVRNGMLATKLTYRDVGGREAALILLGQDDWLKVTVKDKEGKELNTSSSITPGSYAWRVPNDVKGTLTVEVDTSKLPVKVDCPPVKVEVE